MSSKPRELKLEKESLTSRAKTVVTRGGKKLRYFPPQELMWRLSPHDELVLHAKKVLGFRIFDEDMKKKVIDYNRL